MSVGGAEVGAATPGVSVGWGETTSVELVGTASEGKATCVSVAVGVGGLGVLVGVGVTAKPMDNGPQAIISQTKTNKSRVARIILYRPRRVSEKEVKAKIHPP
jgi:hypothetical protein